MHSNITTRTSMQYAIIAIEVRVKHRTPLAVRKSKIK